MTQNVSFQPPMLETLSSERTNPQNVFVNAIYSFFKTEGLMTSSACRSKLKALAVTRSKVGLLAAVKLNKCRLVIRFDTAKANLYKTWAVEEACGVEDLPKMKRENAPRSLALVLVSLNKIKTLEKMMWQAELLPVVESDRSVETSQAADSNQNDSPQGVVDLIFFPDSTPPRKLSGPHQQRRRYSRNVIQTKVTKKKKMSEQSKFPSLCPTRLAAEVLRRNRFNGKRCSGSCPFAHGNVEHMTSGKLVYLCRKSLFNGTYENQRKFNTSIIGKLFNQVVADHRS